MEDKIVPDFPHEHSADDLMSIRRRVGLTLERQDNLIDSENLVFLAQENRQALAPIANLTGKP
jgi:hypothetical protein